MAQYSTAAHTAAFEEELKEHHMRVSKICEEIARNINISHSDIIELLLAAQLHDIGKLWIPQQILDKPEKLNEKEMEIVKKHVFYGYEYVKNKKMSNSTAEAVLYHHERFDGKGYIGLAGEEIPLFSRIITVADAFDVMTNSRPYKETISIEEAIKELISNSGTQFDPDIVDIFINLDLYQRQE